jgi:isoquinoline 1-oxidoreductase subunit alpha
MIQLKVNGTEQSFNGAAEMPLLWYLRDILGLTGSNFGCGIGPCGA